MIDDISILLFGFLAIAGTLMAAFSREEFEKLISIGIIAAGIMPFIIAGGYTDVAIAVSLIAPVTTIFILMVCRSDADDSA